MKGQCNSGLVGIWRIHLDTVSQGYRAEKKCQCAVPILCHRSPRGGSWNLSDPEGPGVRLAPRRESVEIPARDFLVLQFPFSVALEPLRSGWQPSVKMPVCPESESV